MIGKHIFANGMAILAGAFGREVDPETSQTYYLVLRDQLSDDEFKLAVRETITSERFWPSPAVLLAKVRPPIDADVALEDVLDRVRRAGGFRFFPHDEYLALSAAQQAGVRAAGGVAALTVADSDREIARVRKLFRLAFEEASAPKVLAIHGADRRDRQLPRGEQVEAT